MIDVDNSMNPSRVVQAVRAWLAHPEHGALYEGLIGAVLVWGYWPEGRSDIGRRLRGAVRVLNALDLLRRGTAVAAASASGEDQPDDGYQSILTHFATPRIVSHQRHLGAGEIVPRVSLSIVAGVSSSQSCQTQHAEQSGRRQAGQVLSTLASQGPRPWRQRQ